MGGRSYVLTVRPLPAAFLDALRDGDEVLVTSRDPESGRRGTVPMWFLAAPGGAVYLLTYAFSRKAERWRRDPWVRLRVPGDGGPAVEGVVHFVTDRAEVEEIAPLAVERWDMAGAATPEALHRLLDDGTHALLRVDGAA
jgi:general stress protein 26